MVSARGGHAGYTPGAFNGARWQECQPQELPMKKLVIPLVTAAALGLGMAGAAFAQASGAENPGNQPSYGPPVGSPDYYGNSGWTPSDARPHYPYTVPAPRAFGREGDVVRRER